MEKRLLKTVIPVNAAKELIAVLETVTCLECCKFYILPETAICGHTLCHGCWIGRQTCPVCALPLRRRALKANETIKTYTESVQKTAALFEKKYNIKLEEYAPGPPVHAMNKIVEKDPRKNVDAWLCDSQNHFSAPVSSQLSTQADSPAVEVKTCKIQVHTDSKKTTSSTKITQAPIAPPPAQGDWDKIESVPDTEEFGKNKENVGPIDFEPFSLDDEEYTTDHPRRSSRHRDLKHESKRSETSADKHSSSSMSMDTDKLSRIKQNWSNVKKMRKEFSKLHKKKNKNKLNVSIEMCKKSKSAISKPATSVEAESEKLIIIEDLTPDVKEEEVKEESPVLDKIPMEINDKNDNEDNNNKSSRKELPADLHSFQEININEGDKIKANKIDYTPNSSSILNNFKDTTNNIKNREHNDPDEKSTARSHFPFIKKSTLQTDNPTDDLGNNTGNTERVQENTVKTVDHVINDNIETDSDDIQITIKIGSTLTNIFIKKKKNDVKVKLNTDQEVQTSQCMENSTSCKTPPSRPKSCDVQHIEINVGSEGVVSAVTQATSSNEANIGHNNVNLDKTVLKKKNTASDETITVDISPSLEKELTKIMECDDDDNNGIVKDKPQEKHKDVNKISTAPSNKEPNTQDMEIDEDIFASGSVKEGNVQLLENTKAAPSEILMPTLIQSKKTTQTQKQADKRNRENDDEVTKNKKFKVTSNIYENSIEDVPNEDNKDESSINYDSVMGQVFASIDADMANVGKSQSVINDNQDRALVDNQPTTPVITQHSQYLKTQKTQRKVLGLSKMTNATQNAKSNLHQKDSESLFALSNVESQVVPEKSQNKKPGPETQAHIESLLTPGMCRDLAASQCGDMPATPHDHDSDTSVCEETPQKASFTRKSNAGSNGSNQAKPSTQQSQLHPNEAQLIKEIINISDTEPTKDSTVAKPKKTLETPTINQFCNSVQHNSTPVARKSLNFADQLISSSILVQKNAQELFPKPRTPQAVPRYCVAASCLAAAEVRAVEALCARKNWTFVKEFTKELTHLVVGVDEEGRSQRTVKFMCALAAGKWIVRYQWAEAWMRRGAAAEERFEALDWTGEPGPRRARTAARKLFQGFTFYCMPPFSVLSEPVLKVMLESAGGRVASEAREVRVVGDDVRVLLAEPEHTQENQFTYMALELSIVPVNYEWALNCLGSYTLSSMLELMLCPTSLMPAAAARWPAALLAQDEDAAVDEDED